MLVDIDENLKYAHFLPKTGGIPTACQWCTRLWGYNCAPK